MDQQLQLLPLKMAPTVSGVDVELFITWLAGKGWQTSKEIMDLTPWKDRYLRAMANASEGRIISGQLGYKLTQEATLEEIEHASAWLRHQANEMTRRAVAIERVRHGRK